MKDTEINIPLKLGPFPLEQKNPASTITPTRRGREVEKLVQSQHLEKIKDVDKDCFV